MAVKKIILLAVGVFFASQIFGGFAYGAAEVQALQGKEPAEKARIQALIDGASKEKKLLWIGGMIDPSGVKIIQKGFQEYYGLPGIIFEFTYAGSSDGIPRVEQALKAEKAIPDVVWFPTWAWYKDLLSRGQIMKYDSPMYKEYTLSHRAGNSKPGYWVSDGYSFHPMWNVTALEKAGIKNFNPASWNDFTDPKLAKMTAIGNIGRSLIYTNIGIGLKKVLGEEWFIKVARLKPAVYMRANQGRDWCASGEFPIILFGNADKAEDVKKSGVTVKLLYPKEGIVVMPFAPVILTAAPHPNTAKLFIDYVRSGAGTNRIASSGVWLLYGRPGVKAPPNEFLPGMEDIKVIPMDWDKDLTMEDVIKFQKWVKDIELTF